MSTAADSGGDRFGAIDLASGRTASVVRQDEDDAAELARRVAASDVGDTTLTRLEALVDELAVAYTVEAPIALLDRVRQYLSYVTQLLDGRKTLAEHRRLLIAGAWLSLLGATFHIDLKQPAAAAARLRTATDLARQAGHPEIEAWCLETEAWHQLTEGDYRSAVMLSRAAQRTAPRGSSARVQATAQEGRAWARIGDAEKTHLAIDQVAALVGPLPPERNPEHHYRYDPDKFTAYTATTLAWLGDPAAEGYARTVIARLRGADRHGKWPRRIATANLDLALALLAADRPDEAVCATQEAIGSGLLAASNYWRVLELVCAVERRAVPGAADLRDAYEVMHRAG